MGFIEGDFPVRTEAGEPAIFSHFTQAAGWGTTTSQGNIPRISDKWQ